MSISLNNHEQRITELEKGKVNTVAPWRYATKLCGDGTKSFSLPSNCQEFKCIGFNPGDPTTTVGGVKQSYYGGYVFARNESYPYGKFTISFSGSPVSFKVENNTITLTNWSDGDEYIFIYVR